ncbi:DUF4038 domain-containing protein [Oceaniglobus roseus]|uniref:apiosidase-like domain-containing protein n=1 Tax=Oceaniglobus roseus TaxID=1737570 RepID=UPI001562B2D9|nr:DUF4038 domain-containing protein [Kandeliimicrobium roseum]
MAALRPWLAALLLVAGVQAAPAWPTTEFPLSVSADRTHLRDGSGRPVLLVGDAAWSLLVQPGDDDIELYLRDRRARGFNALLVNLIEHQFSDHPPANAHGERPFAGQPFEAPDTAYFDRAHRVLERARALGFTVFLAPAYIGSGGGGQGWWVEMAAAGPERLRRYGTFLGQRFGDLDNIVWTEGGDEDAPDPALVTALAEGIRAADPGALQTVHSRRDTVTAALWADAPWLDLDTAYTYGDVYAKVAEQRRDDHDLPVVMIESRYENERDATPPSLREAGYGAVMAGAAGFVFGNNPIWHFDSVGLFAAANGWKAELGGAGSVAMGHMRAFFEPLAWWRLRDDAEGRVCGWRSRFGGAKCALADDGSFAVVYSPGGGPLRIRTDAFAGGPVCATWYAPQDGSRHPAPAPLAEGEDLVTPPLRADDSGGDSDWVLLLASCAAPKAAGGRS